MNLYHYRTNFDMDGLRTCATPEETYTFGFVDYEDQQDVHKPFRKRAIEISQETPKGYKDAFGNLYLKKDIDMVLITNHAGRRINCSIDYYSFDDSISLYEIKNRFIEKVLAAFKG